MNETVVLDLNAVADQIVNLAREKYLKQSVELQPRSIHEFNRVRDIVGAIEQRAKDGKPIELEWVTELKDLLRL